MRRVKFPVVSIVLYVLAGLLALYAIWAAIYSFKYISEMVASNQLVIKGSEFEVANFLMNNIAQHAVFAVILFALGRILQVNQASSFEEIADEEIDEDIDEDTDADTDEAEVEDLEQNAAE